MGVLILKVPSNLFYQTYSLSGNSKFLIRRNYHNSGVPAVKTYDVILRVKPEKVGQIHSDTINGQKCLIIPMDENEHAAVNGVNTTI